MTNEEVIKTLKANYPDACFEQLREAVDMAIEALNGQPEHSQKASSKQPESAQWVQMLINPNLYKCSNCQIAWNKRLVFDNDGYSKNIFMKYCPCCGRKMQTKVDYE